MSGAKAQLVEHLWVQSPEFKPLLPKKCERSIQWNIISQ
jgi:hypothetical protein